MHFMIITTDGTYLLYKDNFLNALMEAEEKHGDDLIGIIICLYS